VSFGSGIWKNPLFRIPNPGVKKAPDPGSGSATLRYRVTLEADYYLHQEFGYVAFRSFDPSCQVCYGTVPTFRVFVVLKNLGHFSGLHIGEHQIYHNRNHNSESGWIRSRCSRSGVKIPLLRKKLNLCITKNGSLNIFSFFSHEQNTNFSNCLFAEKAAVESLLYFLIMLNPQTLSYSWLKICFLHKFYLVPFFAGQATPELLNVKAFEAKLVELFKLPPVQGNR
jgi:hypothetical protein